jgi:ABC-type polysaccharide/polyol phosphate export permease
VTGYVEMKTSIRSIMRDIFSHTYLGFNDIIVRYRRTSFGPLWMVVGSIINIFTTSYVFSSIFQLSISEILPFISAGIICWGFLASLIGDGCTTFVAASGIIGYYPVSFVPICVRTFVRNFIVFLHNIPVLIAVSLYFSKPIFPYILMVFPVMILLFITSISFTIVFGFLSSRFRDIPQLVNYMLGILFFVTPVIWSIEMLKSRTFLVYFNPLTYYMDVLRSPFIGQWPKPLSLFIVLLITVILSIVAFFVFKMYRKRLAFWIQ